MAEKLSTGGEGMRWSGKSRRKIGKRNAESIFKVKSFFEGGEKCKKELNKCLL